MLKMEENIEFLTLNDVEGLLSSVLPINISAAKTTNVELNFYITTHPSQRLALYVSTMKKTDILKMKENLHEIIENIGLPLAFVDKNPITLLPAGLSFLEKYIWRRAKITHEETFLKGKQVVVQEKIENENLKENAVVAVYNENDVFLGIAGIKLAVNGKIYVEQLVTTKKLKEIEKKVHYKSK